MQGGEGPPAPTERLIMKTATILPNTVIVENSFKCDDGTDFLAIRGNGKATGHPNVLEFKGKVYARTGYNSDIDRVFYSTRGQTAKVIR